MERILSRKREVKQKAVYVVPRARRIVSRVRDMAMTKGWLDGVEQLCIIVEVAMRKPVQ